LLEISNKLKLIFSNISTAFPNIFSSQKLKFKINAELYV